MDSNKKIVTKEIWLNYFNSYLYEKNIITEVKRNKMKNLIHQNCHASSKKNFF